MLGSGGVFKHAFSCTNETAHSSSVTGEIDGLVVKTHSNTNKKTLHTTLNIDHHDAVDVGPSNPLPTGEGEKLGSQSDCLVAQQLSMHNCQVKTMPTYNYLLLMSALFTYVHSLYLILR